MANPLNAMNTGVTGQGAGDANSGNIFSGLGDAVANIAVKYIPGMSGGGGGEDKYQQYTPREEYFQVDPNRVLENEWRKGKIEAGMRQSYRPDLQRADSSAAQQVRGGQLENLAALQAAAEGRGGPSLAEELVARERERNIAQSMALASSGKGMAPGAALRQGQQQAGAASRAAVQQGAEIQAQEQAMARQMYSQALTGVREQDMSQMGIEQQANLAQMNALLQSEMGQRQLNDQMVQSYLAMGMSLEQARLQANVEIERLRAEQQIAANQGLMYREEGSANRESSILGGVLSAGGILGAAALLSDENAKENIEEGEPAIAQFMDALESYEFDYKDEEHGEGRQYGIMVQDLEKSEAGKTMVTNIGKYKAIDAVKAVGPILSSIAALNKRQKEIEKILREK